MPGTIQHIYILNHSHTDIGFTDHQEVVLRQHEEFIDQAIRLCELTADFPPEAQYRWTCEVTGTTERYLEHASDSQRERFMAWHRAGRIDVAGMQYNFTPLLGVEQMYRSLQPVRRLRERFGIEIDTAMQSDVNGIAWLFSDLLPAMEIGFLSMAANPVRGGLPKPYPSAFWWESAAGKRLLVWNGYHYLFGRSVLKLGDWRFAESEVQRFVMKLEQRDDYPFDFLFFQSTHPMRVDNGPPDLEIATFVRKWNELGKTPRMQLVGHREFARILSAQQAGLPVLRGEWMDWWCDGVASTAFETGVARESHHVLQAAEVLAGWMTLRNWGQPPYSREEVASAYELSTLYDEHTWGAYASVAAPDAPWTKGQENHKAGFAFRAAAHAHNMLAQAAGTVAAAVTEGGPPGRFNLGDLTPSQAYPLDEDRGLLVLNTLPWERRVIVDEPEQRGGAAPAGVLDMFFPEGVPWGGDKPRTDRVSCEAVLPGWGWAFVRDRCQASPSLRASGATIENDWYRVTVDERSGGLLEWLDKTDDVNLAGHHDGWRIGQYIYETVNDPQGREALFAADFSARDFGTWGDGTAMSRATATDVKVRAAHLLPGRARVAVDIEAPGISSGSCTYTLWQHTPRLDVEWTLSKQRIAEPESVFFAFPFALKGARFVGDFNGLVCRPGQEQLPGSVTAWYPVQGWVGVESEEASVVVVPVDAPLVHLGAINTGRRVNAPPGAPVVMSWPMNNHWSVNFKAAQDGSIHFRYSMTSTPGRLDVAAAARFAAEVRTPPLVLRDRIATGADRGQVIDIVEGAEAIVGCKPAENGTGIVLRFLNQRDSQQVVSVDLGRPVRHAHEVLPDERHASAVTVDGHRVSVIVDARQSSSVLIQW
jgi:alpha-mannosidase